MKKEYPKNEIEALRTQLIDTCASTGLNVGDCIVAVGQCLVSLNMSMWKGHGVNMARAGMYMIQHSMALDTQEIIAGMEQAHAAREAANAKKRD